MHQRFALLAVTAVATLACSGGEPVSVGENHPAKTGELLSDYAASWDGYVEAHSFQSGSDRVRLTLDENGEGYLEIGDVPLVPAPADPDAGYLDVADIDDVDAAFRIHEGFHYTANESAVHNSRIQLSVLNQEVFQSWCELQAPVVQPSRATGYGCIPATDFGRSDGQCYYTTDVMTEIPVDCGKGMLCLYVCECDAETCSTPSVLTPSDTRLDGALENDGNALVGTLLLGSERVTVRLERH